jgi:polar amino acid transport system substrate-binding protein
MGNKFAGIDMEIAKGFADYLGWELVIMDMDFNSVVTSVGKNGVDIAMAGLTVNETRRQSVNFTDTYYNASQVVIVKNDNTALDGLTTAEEICAVLNAGGLTIGVQEGTTGEFYVKGDEDWGFDGLNATCNAYSNAALAVQDLKNGNVDYVIVDEAPAKNIAASVGGVKVITVALTVEEYAFGVAKDQPQLLESANTYLALIKSNGTYEKIAQKYFSNDIESN